MQMVSLQVRELEHKAPKVGVSVICGHLLLWGTEILQDPNALSELQQLAGGSSVSLDLRSQAIG